MKPHLIIKLNAPIQQQPVSWDVSLLDKSGVLTRFMPELDRLFDAFRIPFWVASEYHPRRQHWSEEEIASGLNRIYRIILQNDSMVPSALVERIRVLPQVEFIRMGSIGQTDLPSPSISEATSYQSAYRTDRTNLRQAHLFSRGVPEIKIAVLDTGVDLNHQELESILLPGMDYVDIINGASEFIGDFLGMDAVPTDEVGHGSHVTGIVAGKGKNMPIGVAPNCRIIPVRVLGAMSRNGTVVGAGLIDNINNGIKWAVDEGADVINMSLGIRHEQGGLPHAEVIEYALRRGATVVAAAGNDGTNDKYYPGALPGVVAVGAVDETDNIAPFSTYGAHISLTAPGNQIFSCFTNGGYAFSSGTSQAAPFVSGVVALLKSLAYENGKPLKDHQVKYLLKHTSDKPGSTFRTEKSGFGRVNVFDAMKLLKYHLQIQ
ncbi:MAG: S8 family serine peptidase [Saprospiraceae bacterium]|nr:S8 family serine peptidase [Saprospiraceae bacterium]